MTTEIANEFKHQRNLGNIDMDANTFRIILMASGFVFNKDTHQNLSNISANELGAGNGYSTGGQVLAGVNVVKDDTNDRSRVTWNDVTWNASGGAIGPSPGAAIYKDTGTPSTSTIVGYLDFGGDQTANDGAPFIVRNIILDAQ